MLLFLKPLSRLMDMEPLLIVLVMVTALGSFGVNFMNQKLNFELKAGRNMALSISVAVLNLGLSILFVMLLPEEDRLYGRVASMALTYGLFGISSCVLVLLRGKVYFRRPYWRFCLSLSLPVLFYGLTDLLLGHSDLVMLRSMDSSESSGIYGLAYQISSVMFMIFTAINTSWVAFFFQDMKQGRKDAVITQSKNFLELYTILACGFILLVPEVFRTLAPEAFHPGTGLIPFMVASFYLNFLCTFPYNYECFHKKMHVISIVTVVSALINIALNYVMILHWGMYGAAIATLLARVIQFGAHFIYSRFFLGKRDYLFGMRVWGIYALGFTAVMILVMIFPQTWLLRWGIGAVLGVWELIQIRKRRGLL
jgi:O-antigen/teichoic acid export membrane protein